MRIPVEAMVLFLSERNTPEIKRTEPVDTSVHLSDSTQYSLNHWSPRDTPPGSPPTEQHQPPPTPTKEPQWPSAEPLIMEERRKQDRRQRNEPVLLDTRLSHCRRKSDRPAGISFKA